VFCIAGIATPWLESTIEPYARGLRGWRDVTGDVSHQPRIAQFRIDLRSVAAWLEKLAAGHGAQIVHELRGSHFDVDGAHGDFLWPQIAPEEIAPSAKNDDSLVFRVKFRERSFLLPGDAETLSEHYMLSESDPASTQSDVLKVGHHDSKNSTIPNFLAAVQPRLAVISSGEENPYGHPNQQLLDRLRQAAVPTLRTDTNGAVRIVTDGEKLEVSCFIACPEINARLNSRKAQTPQNEQRNEQE